MQPYQMGMPEAVLNGRSVCKKMGERYLETESVDTNGKTLKEVAYGWDDLPSSPR